MFVNNSLPPTGELGVYSMAIRGVLARVAELCCACPLLCASSSNTQYFDVCFVLDVFASLAELMSNIYDKHKSDDGFLYMTYSGENTFG